MEILKDRMLFEIFPGGSIFWNIDIESCYSRRNRISGSRLLLLHWKVIYNGASYPVRLTVITVISYGCTVGSKRFVLLLGPRDIVGFNPS